MVPVSSIRVSLSSKLISYIILVEFKIYRLLSRSFTYLVLDYLDVVFCLFRGCYHPIQFWGRVINYSFSPFS